MSKNVILKNKIELEQSQDAEKNVTISLCVNANYQIEQHAVDTLMAQLVSTSKLAGFVKKEKKSKKNQTVDNYV